MPPKSRQPGEGQLGFDGSVVTLPKVVDPERPRNALARTLTMEYMDLDPNAFTDITVEMVAYVQPDRLQGALIDVPLDIEKSPSAASYTGNTRGGRREVNIALTDTEAKLIPRFVGAIQRNAAINVGAKITTPVPTDADIARKGRSKTHVQESKLPKVEEYHDMLLEQRTLLEKFIKASDGSNVGLSMFGDEGALREKFAYLRTFIIGDMIRAYGTQRKLTESQMKTMERALTVSIFYHPNKVDNFHNLVKFLREYNGHKLLLAQQRIDSMKRNIGNVVVQST